MDNLYLLKSSSHLCRRKWLRPMSREWCVGYILTWKLNETGQRRTNTQTRSWKNTDIQIRSKMWTIEGNKWRHTGVCRRSGWQRMKELAGKCKVVVADGESGVERTKRGGEKETFFLLNNCFTLTCTKTQRWRDLPVVFSRSCRWSWWIVEAGFWSNAASPGRRAGG